MFNPVCLDAGNGGPMTGAGNHTYLVIDSTRSAVLVDAGTGQPGHLSAIRSALGPRNATLTHVLVTHGHADHIDGAAALAAEHGDARFHKHAGIDEAQTDVPWRALVNHDLVLVGETSLIVLHTPGHAPDHCAFWHEPTGTVFTGDLLVLGGSVAIPFSRGGDVAQYLASLRRLLALGASRLLPAHGPAIESPASAIGEAIAHRLMRERQVIDAVLAGCDTVAAIVGSIYDGLSPALLPAAGDTVRAHLEKLRREDCVREEHGRWRA
jgi:glyoxylase-like metal-dependent hydrolase (beta-lactamase superfamily II)